jgi:hypothetical protein
METRWNDTDRGKPKKSEEILPHSHFIHHIYHMDPGLRGEVGD